MECDKLKSDSDETVSSSDDDSESVNERKIPLQLMVEMVNSLVRKEYMVAKKLATMILIYQPDHQQAKDILFNIEEKEKLEAEDTDEEDVEEDDEQESSEIDDESNSDLSDTSQSDENSDDTSD